MGFIMDLPDNLKYILSALENAGFEAYVVGGAVRDKLLGVNCEDHDVTTNAKTEDILRIFSDCKIIPTGLKHGTVTVIYNGSSFEITTFRSDGEYTDMRHPDKVTFVTNINEDLARRDFTVNSMAYSKTLGFIDVFNGQNDLNERTLRAVGDPEKRFEEDALRIIRAVRFAAKLGFSIEENTLKAAYKKLDNLSKLSVERVFSELTLTLCAKHAPFALDKYRKIFFAVLPELSAMDGCEQYNRSHSYNVYEHTLKALESCENVTPIIAWAIILHDAGKPFTRIVGEDGFQHFPDHWIVSEEIAVKVLTRLKAPKAFIDEVRFLVLYHDNLLLGGKPYLKRLLKKYKTSYIDDLFVVKKADLYAHSEFGIKRFEPYYEKSLKEYREIIENDECYSFDKLDISGDEIKALGFSGKKVGQLLGVALDAVIDGKIPDEKDKIIEFIKNYE